MCAVHFAPAGWRRQNDNPFTGRPFGNDWRGIFLSGKNDSTISNGLSASGLFGVVFGRCVPELDLRTRDFVHYESSLNHEIIVGSDYIKDLPTLFSAPRADVRSAVRQSDPRYTVHSTTMENWQSIRKDMMLKSPNFQQSGGQLCEPIGRKLLGDPDDYLDYIHFAPGTSFLRNWFSCPVRAAG